MVHNITQYHLPPICCYNTILNLYKHTMLEDNDKLYHTTTFKKCNRHMMPSLTCDASAVLSAKQRMCNCGNFMAQ